MRTAIVHYWLVRMRGGENVLRELLRAHPDADVFTNVYHKAGVAELFADRPPPFTTRINSLPAAKKLYPVYMPMMPAALERLDLNSYDLVISHEAGPAKWIIPGPTARHVCYVSSPMRYLWDQRLLYRDRLIPPLRPIFDKVTADLRYKDIASAQRVDDFVANSSFVAARIQKYYQRTARIIHPPVDLSDFGPAQEPEDYYLFAGQLVSYKNVRQAVEACLKLGKRLVVVGEGSDAGYVRSLAGGLIDYRGRVSRAELVSLMSRCKALLFPGLEDFGIIPVEALAAGRPVVAYGRGGILDTVTDRQTGVLYDAPTTDDLVRAIQTFEEWLPEFDPQQAIWAASRFSAHRFVREWKALIQGEAAPEARPVRRQEGAPIGAARPAADLAALEI